MKIVFTGGHHNSALVIAKKLVDKNNKVVWLGHKYASENDLNTSAEYQEVTYSGISFYNINAGKISAYKRFKNLAKFPLGFYQSIKVLKKEKPDLVFSFGGYLGATVSFAAWLKNIPVFVHEQTSVAGKANLFSSRFAEKIFISWESSKSYYPSEKTIYSGLPLRKSIIEPKLIRPFSNSKKTILVLGGKQGSHTINKLIFSSIDELLKKYNLIHQTGTNSVTNDYERANTIKETHKHSKSYKPYGYITESEIGSYIKSADLVISRSGAHTTYELGMLSKPCILIPFEHTHLKEQLKNAKILEDANLAIILREKSLTDNKLLKTISLKIKSKKKHKNLKLPKEAEKIIIKEIFNHLK